MATFTNQEYVDIHFIYEYCDENARAELREYLWRFFNRRISHQTVFSNVHWHLANYGTFPTTTAEGSTATTCFEEEDILNNPSTSVQRQQLCWC